MSRYELLHSIASISTTAAAAPVHAHTALRSNSLSSTHGLIPQRTAETVQPDT
jgi:hypothetical protein